jgi:hypothetical protein
LDIILVLYGEVYAPPNILLEKAVDGVLDKVIIYLFVMIGG